MLIGLCGAELVGPSSVGASEGFLGWIAYLGAANAGEGGGGESKGNQGEGDGIGSLVLFSQPSSQSFP